MEGERQTTEDASDESMRTPAGQSTVTGAVSSAPARLPSGSHFGRYVIQRELGSGGLGRVYLARDTTLRREVAIKIVSAAEGTGSSAQRFAREAESASALNHPHIVTVHETGVEQGIPYIAMEYLSGGSLQTVIRSGGLEPARFFPWAIQICDALAAAHEAGLLHRDLKPGNIMISGRGAAKIVDFGLARSISTPPDAEEPLTATGVILGTAGYMAPEQAQGKPLDARADIFALGCLLFEMAAGRRAFTGSTRWEILAAAIHKEPDLSGLRPEYRALEPVLALCLKKNPQERWQSAADLRYLLEEMRAARSGPDPVRGSARTARGTALIATAIAAALILAAAGGYLSRRDPQPSRPVATTMLTTDAGLATDPALSLDGRMLVYASDRGQQKNLDLWLQQIGGNAPLQLTSDPADETAPDFSPDGTRIVFRSERDGGGLYVIPSLGGDPVLLVQQGRNPRFSPDGKWILYWSGRESISLLPGSTDAYVIPSGGGQPRRISEKLAAAMYPVWSPDGQRILAVARRSNDLKAEPQPDWWSIPFDSAGEPAAAGTNSLFATLGSPGQRTPWSQATVVPLLWRSGGPVYFAARLGDSANLFLAALDPASRQFRTPARQVTSGTGYETQAAIARAGATERMAFSSHTLQFDLWSLPADVESGTVKSEPRRLTESASFEFVPSVSSDGARVSYLTSRNGVSSLAVRELASQKEKILLTARLAYPQMPSDGRSITFVDEQLRLMRIASNGGGAKVLCERCGTPTGMSADGMRVLLEPFEAPEDVHSLDAASGKITTLVPAKERLFGAKFSPDGKRVLFLALPPGSDNGQIFVASIEGQKPPARSEWIEITERGSGSQNAAWSPSGKRIYFQSDRDGFRCIYSRKLNSQGRPDGPVAGFQHFHSARRSLQALRRWDARSQMAILPDRVIVVLGELTGNLWMRDLSQP